MNEMFPSAARLTKVLDWLNDAMDEEEATSFTTEVSGDPSLRADVAWVKFVLDAGEAVPLHEPPGLLRQRLRQQFHQHMRAQEIVEPGAFELRASLVFDSRVGQLAGSLRGSATDTDIVHQVWRTDAADVMLQVQPHPDGGVSLSGQVLLQHSTSAPVFEAVAVGEGQRTSSPWGDEFGRFNIDVRAEDFELRVSNGEVTVLIPFPLTGL